MNINFGTYSSHRWEFEESLLDRAVIIDMDRILKHEIDEVGCRFDKFIELLQVFELAALLFIEYVEVVLRGIKLHVFNLSC